MGENDITMYEQEADIDNDLCECGHNREDHGAEGGGACLLCPYSATKDLAACEEFVE